MIVWKKSEDDEYWCGFDQDVWVGDIVPIDKGEDTALSYNGNVFVDIDTEWLQVHSMQAWAANDNVLPLMNRLEEIYGKLKGVAKDL